MKNISYRTSENQKGVRILISNSSFEVILEGSKLNEKNKQIVKRVICGGENQSGIARELDVKQPYICKLVTNFKRVNRIKEITIDTAEWDLERIVSLIKDETKHN